MYIEDFICELKKVYNTVRVGFIEGRVEHSPSDLGVIVEHKDMIFNIKIISSRLEVIYIYMFIIEPPDNSLSKVGYSLSTGVASNLFSDSSLISTMEVGRELIKYFYLTIDKLISLREGRPDLVVSSLNNWIDNLMVDILPDFKISSKYRGDNSILYDINYKGYVAERGIVVNYPRDRFITLDIDVLNRDTYELQVSCYNSSQINHCNTCSISELNKVVIEQLVRLYLGNPERDLLRILGRLQEHDKV